MPCARTCQPPCSQWVSTQCISSCESPPDRAKRTHRRGAARSCHSAVNSSSAGTTATPSAGRDAITDPFSRATACTVCINSRCSRWALFTRATVGCAIAASVAISPGWFIPSSTTAMRWPARRRSNVSGTPMSLLKLPRVANAPPPGHWASRIAASIWVTVVLPLLPVTAITGNVNRARQVVARDCSAALVSATSILGSPAGYRSARRPAWHTTPKAPRCCASCRNSLAS